MRHSSNGSCRMLGNTLTFGGSGNSEATTNLKDGLRSIADGLDRYVSVEKTHDAAGAALKTFITPGERANNATLPQHHFDIATQVLGMQQAFLKGPAVEREHVLLHPAA